MVGIIVFLMFIFVLSIFIKPDKKKKKEYEDIPRSVEIGNEGESLVEFFLSSKEEGKLINNLLIKVKGKYAQIDHVFITKTDIYVIETKNYNGTIYGKEYDDKWTCVYRTGIKHSLYNPVKQNNTHIARIRELLKDDTVKIQSLVILANDNCKMQYEVDGVYTLEDLKNNYDNIVSNSIIDKENIIDVNKYYNKLMKYDLSNDKTAVENQIKFANKSKYASYNKKA